MTTLSVQTLPAPFIIRHALPFPGGVISRPWHATMPSVGDGGAASSYTAPATPLPRSPAGAMAAARFVEAPASGNGGAAHGVSGGGNGNGAGGKATDLTQDITRLLSSDDPHVRSCAAVSLGKTRAPEAAPALLFALLTDDDAPVRAKAAEALAEIDVAAGAHASADSITPAEIAEALVFTLSDPSELVREKVQPVLTRLGRDPARGKPVLELLIAMVRGRGRGGLAIEGDAAIPGKTPPLDARGFERLCAGAALALGPIHAPEAVPPLLELLQQGADRVRPGFREDPVHLREAAATALGWYGPEAGTDTVRAVRALLANDPFLLKAYEEASATAVRQRPFNAPRR